MTQPDYFYTTDKWRDYGLTVWTTNPGSGADRERAIRCHDLVSKFLDGSYTAREIWYKALLDKDVPPYLDILFKAIDHYKVDKKLYIKEYR